MILHDDLNWPNIRLPCVGAMEKVADKTDKN